MVQMSYQFQLLRVAAGTEDKARPLFELIHSNETEFRDGKLMT